LWNTGERNRYAVVVQTRSTAATIRRVFPLTEGPLARHHSSSTAVFAYALASVVTVPEEPRNLSAPLSTYRIPPPEGSLRAS
jgi:hypothetical protein